ncbi:MAG: hypothetical protein H7Z14_12970 [Anaerolineae bacterium]|nr:hypothetical protein [Phycisphaerae bacterium]
MSEPSPIPPAQLDYRNPDTSRGVTLSPAPTLKAYCFVYLVIGGTMFFAVPSLEQTFKDFKIDIPLISKWMLAFARWFRAIGWLILMPIPITIPLSLAQIRHNAPPPRAVRRWRITGITSMVLLLFGVLFMISLWLPMISLFDGISSPKK